MESATLEAKYTGQSSKFFEIKFTDIGTTAALMAPYKMLLNMQMSMEDEKGYQKVAKYNDIPVFERYKKSNKNYEIIAILSDKFLIELDGLDLSILQEFIKNLDKTKFSK